MMANKEPAAEPLPGATDTRSPSLSPFVRNKNPGISPAPKLFLTVYTAS